MSNSTKTLFLPTQNTKPTQNRPQNDTKQK